MKHHVLSLLCVATIVSEIYGAQLLTRTVADLSRQSSLEILRTDTRIQFLAGLTIGTILCCIYYKLSLSEDVLGGEYIESNENMYNSSSSVQNLPVTTITLEQHSARMQVLDCTSREIRKWLCGEYGAISEQGQFILETEKFFVAEEYARLDNLNNASGSLFIEPAFVVTFKRLNVI